MSSFAPILRFTVYAGETGSVALQAPVSAPHQDSFKVASRQGISGYQPFIFDEPQIDGQSLSLPEFTSTVGSCKIRLGDFRVGSSQFERWVTAFVGRSDNDNLLVGRRSLLEVSYDEGTTYTPMYAGRIARAELQDIVMNLEVRDVGFDLKQNVMYGLDPSLSYATQATLYPIGLTRTIPSGGFAGVTPLSGTITSEIAGSQLQTSDINGNSFFSSANGGYEITVDSRNPTYISADQVETLQKAVQSRTTYYASANNGDRGGVYTSALVYAVNSTRGNSGYLTVTSVTTALQGANSTNSNVVKFTTQLLPATFASVGRITVASGWRKSDKIQFYIVKLGEPSEDNPLWVNPPSVQTYIKDIISGRFNFSPTTGVIPLALQTGSNAFNDLSASSSFGLKFKVTKTEPLEDYLRESIFKPLQIGYRSDIDLINGVSGSALSFFNAARPTVAPSTVIDESDIVASETPVWMNDPAYSTIQVNQYVDSKLPQGAITSRQFPTVTYSNVGATLLGGSIVIDGEAFRITSTQQTTQQSGSVIQYVNQLGSALTQQYGRGKLSLRLTVRRNVKTTPLKIGSWVLVDSIVVPNSSTQRRGGQRLMMITNISPSLSTFSLELIDAGLSSSSPTPTFATASYTGSLPNSIVTQWSASTNVEVQYAENPIGVSVVPANSSLWTFAGYSKTLTDKAFLISPVRSGVTASVRVRGVSDNQSVLELPSPWVTCSLVSLPALPPVSSLNVSGITLGQAIVTWQTGSSVHGIEVFVNSPSNTQFTQSLGVLPPNSNRIVITGVEQYPSTSMGVAVRHVDTVGSTSTMVSSSWTATGAVTALPSMSFFYTYLG